MAIQVTRTIGGRTLVLEAGRMARQANGAVVVRYGDSVVLATATMDEARPGIDFFPLTVDYREKTSAAGKIPGGFFKREGRPTTKEILTMRMIDRPTRPLFPEGFHQEVQIQCMVLSADDTNEPDLLAMIGASAALAISDIPWNGPTGSVRMGYVNGELVVNPTVAQIEAGDLNLVVSGTKNALTMVEAGAREVPEAVVVEALAEAQRHIRTVVEAIEELMEKVGKPKVAFEAPAPPAEFEELRAALREPLKAALQVPAKQARAEALREAREAVLARFYPDEVEREEKGLELRKWFDRVEHEVARELLAAGIRMDGRGFREIRPITIETGLLPRTHGSALFTRGETQALATCTLGTTADVQIVDGLLEEVKKSFFLHYNFPPFSVGECRPIRGPGRREIGHGALAERALEVVLPSKDDFPYTIRVVSDILESNGSSSMATVCAGALALMDAGVQIRRPVAGIAMGLLKEGDRVIVLSDILGDEDHHGDMDFKVAGTTEGITALQMDIKVEGIDREILAGALEQAREGRLAILEEMRRALPEPRPQLSPYAPRFALLHVNPDKIGAIIGTGGKTVRKLQEDTGAKIEIVDEKGTVAIFAASDTSLEAARRQVEALTAEPEIGKRYRGRVISIKDFGAFIEILPGQDGLLHISDMGDGYVKRVTDLYKPGDEVEVIVQDINDFGKIRLVLPREARPGEAETAEAKAEKKPEEAPRARESRQEERVQEEEEEEDEELFDEEEEEDFEEELEDEEGEEEEEEDFQAAPAEAAAAKESGGREQTSQPARRRKRRRRRAGGGQTSQASSSSAPKESGGQGRKGRRRRRRSRPRQ